MYNISKILKKLVAIARHLHIIQAIYFFYYPKYRKACREYIPQLKAEEERKKRILIVAPYMSIGGAEKVILDLASNINREKFVVDIVSVTNNPDRPNKWESLYIENSDHLWHIPDITHRAFRSGFLYHISRIRKYDVILMSHAIIYIDSLAPVLNKITAKNKYCIIHDVYPDWSYDVSHYDFFWDKYICVCSYAAKMLVELKCIPAVKTQVVLNGVDTKKFDPLLYQNNVYRNQLNIKLDDKIIAFIARMNPIKHPEYVINLAIIMREYSNIRFIMAGDGPLLKDIRDMVFNKGLQQSIFILGAVEDIPQLMSEIDILYHCAESEAFGLSILEAMAMGKPAVVPKSEGIPEFFEDGVNGIMINFDDNFVENSKEAILSILLEDNKDKYKLINRQKAEILSLKNQVIQYEALFQ